MLPPAFPEYDTISSVGTNRQNSDRSSICQSRDVGGPSFVVFDAPVALIVFNRPKCTQMVFDAIRIAKPSEFFLIADGPRTMERGDRDACRDVLALVDRIDWPCKVMRNISTQNLGMRERTISGLDWVFSQVDKAIILEDDCVPDASFFDFCGELLKRYQDDSRVAMISGTNFVEDYLQTEYSYYFSHMNHLWGWATWRSSWYRYDRFLQRWPEIREARLLSEILEPKAAVYYWTRIFDQIHKGEGPDTWDYQWYFTNLLNNSLSIVPKVNLVTNIGFGFDATNTKDIEFSQSIGSKSLQFPMKHPPHMFPLRSMERYDQEVAYLSPMRKRLTNMVRLIDTLPGA